MKRWIVAPFFAFVAAIACDRANDAPTEAWQGVVEFEDRVVAFEVPGRVLELGVDEGDALEPRDLIARLDPRLDELNREARAAEARAVAAEFALVEAGSRPEDIRSLRASLASARATETLANQSATRARALSRQGAASDAELDAAQTALATAQARRRELEAQMARLRQGARSQELDAAQARVEAAEASVRLAEERISRHSLYADGAGVVLDVHLEAGEFAQVGTPVATLADLTHPYVDVFVPQSDIGQIALGQRVAVRVDARSEPYDGAVESIASETEFTPRFLFSERERPKLVLRVRVRIAAPDATLHAGIPAFVTPRTATS